MVSIVKRSKKRTERNGQPVPRIIGLTHVPIWLRELIMRLAVEYCTSLKPRTPVETALFRAISPPSGVQMDSIGLHKAT